MHKYVAIKTRIVKRPKQWNTDFLIQKTHTKKKNDFTHIGRFMVYGFTARINTIKKTEREKE